MTKRQTLIHLSPGGATLKCCTRAALRRLTLDYATSLAIAAGARRMSTATVAAAAASKKAGSTGTC